MAETNAVRPGEEIDVERLAAFLSSELGLDTAEIDVEQFPAGSSNLTYLITDAGGREYVLRRPPFGNRVASAHDMTREARLLTRLAPVYRLAPLDPTSAPHTCRRGIPYFVVVADQSLASSCRELQGRCRVRLKKLCMVSVTSMTEVATGRTVVMRFV